ncbi:MAG TPA: BamA/TamA family outer membrane protein [Rubrivivax sp.]|nr:BamA/TamA family outer membrane protein [Rubrivivax sp.]
MPVLLAALLSACALLPGGDRNKKKSDDEAGASSRQVDERRMRYTLAVTAPKPLRELLENNLDLARFRDAPGDAALVAEDIDRLVAAAPEQVRALLATEGYFAPTVDVQRLPASGTALPVVQVRVEPGTRAWVDTVSVEVQGELRQRAERGEGDAQALQRSLRAEWPLPPGTHFRQADWADAKNATLGRLHAGGYPAAVWAETDAAVRAKENKVALSASASSGPLFHFGTLTVEGLQRYDERAVRNVAPFAPGTPYTEQRLLDFQERLVRTGLFEGAVAEIDTDPAKAAAAPVSLRVVEQRLQQLTLGLGYSSDTGARLSAQHTHRQPFGLRWTARSELELGPQRRALGFDLRSYPKSGFRRNLIAGEIERWRGKDEQRDAMRLRLGRAWEDPRLERQVYAEYNNTRVEAPGRVANRAQSVTAHLDWTRRDVDSLLLPTRGTALLVQGAAGYAGSSVARDGGLARAYARVFYFRPIAAAWHATLRGEVGHVFAKDGVGIPDTLLFRAGGNDSVRGYDYRTLGPTVGGVVTSGRSLLTASAEVARPITPRLPDLWGAAFVDAGNAAAGFDEIRPVVGIGAGVRYRSPLGPLKADVAYGVEDKQVRLHLSAGVSF